MAEFRRTTPRVLRGDDVDVVATVGIAPDSRLGWLAEFVRRDVAVAESRQRAAVELTAFLYLEYTQPLRSGGVHESRIAILPTYQVEPSEVPELQRVIRDLLISLQPGE